MSTQHPHFYQNAKFIKSAVEFDQLPSDHGAEVAFIGRSNAGKSSALNTITGIKGLARVSKTPGRTQAMNLFGLSQTQRLVDLPGYGYAKVPRTVQQRWEATVHHYLENRECLKGLILIMDIRHPLQEMDKSMLDWTESAELPVHVLLTKADKLSKSVARNILNDMTKILKKEYTHVSVQLFSSFESIGLKDAINLLNAWFSKPQTV